MIKTILALTWKNGGRIVRLIPFLADSGAFVAGVFSLLGHLRMSVLVGVFCVTLVLIGIDWLVSRLDRAVKSNVKSKTPDEQESRSVTGHREIEFAKQSHAQASAAVILETAKVNSQSRLTVKVESESCEIKLSPAHRPVEIIIGEGPPKRVVVEINE
jgi:hypothetical protein